VGSRVLRVKTALFLFSVAQFVGAIVQGFMVMKTLGKGIVSDITIYEAVSVTIAAIIWITLATFKGLPISTTHSAVSAVIGIAFARIIQGYSASISSDLILKIVVSWVISPLAAMSLAIPLYCLFKKILAKTETEIVRLMVIAIMIFSAYSFGANDVGNATGIYTTITSKYMGLPDEYSMRLLAAFASLFITLGALSIGPRVVETLAFKITRLDLDMALAAGMANALVVWMFTTVPYILFGYGLPISTTYAAVGSIIGVGIAKYRSFAGVSFKTVIFIMTAWLLTLPLSALASTAIYFLISRFAGGAL